MEIAHSWIANADRWRIFSNGDSNYVAKGNTRGPSLRIIFEMIASLEQWEADYSIQRNVRGIEFPKVDYTVSARTGERAPITNAEYTLMTSSRSAVCAVWII